jgi:hypothetical protein
MTDDRQPCHDPLEAAISAFRSMSVPDRPPDEQVRARLDTARGDGARPLPVPPPPKRRYLVHVLVSCVVAAVLLPGACALFLLNSGPPESLQVAAPVSPGAAGRVAVVPPPTNRQPLTERRLERLESLEQGVQAAQVIVVATALDWAPAPPHRPGDLPETLIRFQVKRVVKGKLAAKVITTRTPTAAAEFIGKDWVVMLSPEYMVGKYLYARCLAIQFEPTVQAILSRGTK